MIAILISNYFLDDKSDFSSDLKMSEFWQNYQYLHDKNYNNTHNTRLNFLLD